jgi:thioredoxin 1
VSSPHIVHTTDATFSQDVLKSEKPVLLDFWAEWCGPCKMIAPILDEIATEYQDRIKIAKLNIDENPQTPPKFGIRGIPTLILFKNGTVEAQKVGAVSKSQLSAFLDTNLWEATLATRAVTGPTKARATAIVTVTAATTATAVAGPTT